VQNAHLQAVTGEDRSWATVARVLGRNETDCRYFYAFTERPFVQPGDKTIKDVHLLWTEDMVRRLIYDGASC
jgi:hypothetical protein